MTTTEAMLVGAFCMQVYIRRYLSSRRSSKNPIENNRIILVIDIGSSSIRCSPYMITNESNGMISVISDCVQKLAFKLSDMADILQMSTVTGSDACLRIMGIMGVAVDKCILSLRTYDRSFKAVHCIGISSLAMNIFGVDSENTPISPLFTYASKNSGSRLGTLLRATQQEETAHLTTTGTKLHHESYAIEHLRAFTVEKPLVAAKVKSWTTLSSYFISTWTVQNVQVVHEDTTTGPYFCPISYSEASWTGLLKFSSMEWDKSAVALSSIDPTTLPALCDFDDFSHRKTCPDRLLLYPELKNVRFYAGIGDGAAATVGSKCEGSHRVCVTIGTSCAVRVIVRHSDTFQHSLPPKGLFCYRLDKDRLLIGGALTDGGSLLDWFEGLVGTKIYRKSLREIEAMYTDTTSQGYGSISVLPFWSGERSIGWNDQMVGTISGLSHNSSATSMLLGIMEGVAFRISVIISLLRDANLIAASPNACLVASGTALESSIAFRQMIANMSGYSMVSLRADERGEATSCGIATMIVESMCAEKQRLGPSGGLASHSLNAGATLRAETNMWGFNASEVSSITRPQTAPSSRDYVKRRVAENSALYERMTRNTYDTST
jgi:gluconokinase